MASIPQQELDALSSQFRKRARFLVDESLGPEVARVVAGAGWNTKYVGDVGLLGHSDEDALAYAHREDRILLTHDADFLDDHRFPPSRNPGIVVLPGASGDERSLLRALGIATSLVGHLRGAYRRTKVEITQDGTVTIRNPGGVSRYRFEKGRLLEWVD